MCYLKGKRVFLGLLTHPLPFFISPYLHWLGCSIFKQRVLDYCYTNRSFRRKIMSSRGIFILAITWIVMSPFWFWAENIALGIIWLCGGVIELFIALVRRSKEKKNK